jgi:hypothetical protein
VSTRARLVGPAVGLLAGVGALGPVLLHRGFTLSYDMVFVPDPPITASTWGMDGSVPRAVPNDLVVALLSHVLPADIVQKLLLLAVFVVGAWGASRFLASVPGAAAAGLLYVWNPYVLERLVIGHLGFLLGLAVLPWAVHAAVGLREGASGAAGRTALWVVVAALTGSTSGVLVAVSALVVAAWPGGAQLRAPERLLPVVVPALLANSVWLLPALLRSGGIPADPAGVAAFAARADTPLGVLPSLLTLGGLWNPATWPAERRNAVLAVAALVVVLLALALGGRALLKLGSGAGRAVALLGGAGLALALAASVPGARTLVRWVVDDVPGGGLVRDSQKLLMPLVLVVALAAGHAVERLVRRPALVSVAVGIVALPVLLLPSLGWGAHGRLASVGYPAEWTQVQQLVAAQPGTGDVASFPWGYYRRFPWNGNRVVLDPMPRLLPRVVVVNDDLPLADRTVRGEDPRAARIGAVLASGAPLAPELRREGITLAVVDLAAPDAATYRARLAGLPVLHDGPGLLLVDVGPAPPPEGRTPAGAATGWVLLALALGGASLARIMSALGRPLLPLRQPRKAEAAQTHGSETHMDRQAGRGDEGGVLVALIALVVGLVLAGLGSAALVTAGTSGSGGAPITQPLVKYDSP